ncbi:MAG: hypothetical protein GC186_16745 [Rhodobacteraceae bacterium]|nr:hypothetical protein [Paracoccaceae bacterium]
MRNMRLTGPGAGSEKYDLLTALAVNGLAMGGVTQASMMRLIAVVTARYNWALDELSIGQKDMAALWSVDERTAKRETKRLIEAGLLEVKRPGVRGRVAVYRLNVAEIYRRSEPHWTNVGSDFKSRLGSRIAGAPPDAPAERKVVTIDFRSRSRAEPFDENARPDEHWRQAQLHLAEQHPSLFAAWFAALRLVTIHEDQVHLAAPTRFAAQYVTTHFLSFLEAAMRTQLGRTVKCIVTSEETR